MKDVFELQTWIDKFGEEDLNLDKLKEYLEFVQEAERSRDSERYSEWHHVMPKCFDKEGKYVKYVHLNGADHFRAHMMLTCVFTSLGRKRAMTSALMRMTKSEATKDVPPEEYEESRMLFGETQKGCGNYFSGKVHDDNYKLTMSKNFSGTVMVTDGLSTRRVRTLEEAPEGWKRGVKESSKIKMSRMRKGVNHLEGTIRITNGTEETLIKSDQEIPQGWWKGRKPFSQEHSKNLSESQKGRIYITNGVLTKRIKKDDKIPEGWYRGTGPSMKRGKSHE